MSQTAVRYRRPLNTEQFRTLRLLYWYRFATAKHVATYLHKSHLKVIQKKLRLLEDQAYIAKRYDASYKLRGRPAEYYITPKGARMVRELTAPDAVVVDQVSDQGIKSLYKLGGLSESFRTHCLNVLTISLHLLELYPQRLIPYTGIRLPGLEHFPSWRPDLVVYLKTTHHGSDAAQYFFVDIWDGTRPFFVSVRKARNYVRYAEEEWRPEFGPLPIILQLCNKEREETKLRRQIRRALEESYENITFMTTTTERFLASVRSNKKLWRTVEEDDELCSLD